MRTTSGVPLVNRALHETLERHHHLLFLERTPLDRTPHHSITMEDPFGKTVGFDVPDELRSEVEGKDWLIWMTDTFVVDPTSTDGPVSFVLHSCPASFLDDVEGVSDAIILYPALSVDVMIHEKYGFDHIGLYASGILSFNLD